MVVYKDFQSRGFTTVAAIGHFDYLDTTKVKKLSISADDLRKLEQIVNNSKQMKHFQRKLAGGLLFGQIKFTENNQNSKIAMSIDAESSAIMDLTFRKDYLIKDSLDLKWLLDFEIRLKDR